METITTAFVFILKMYIIGVLLSALAHSILYFYIVHSEEQLRRKILLIQCKGGYIPINYEIAPGFSYNKYSLLSMSIISWVGFILSVMAMFGVRHIKKNISREISKAYHKC